MQTNIGKLDNVSNSLISNEPKIKFAKISEEVVEPKKVAAEEKEEEEEFYTLEELDDLENQSMAYIARNFSNIRFKKSKVFKARQFTGSSSKNSSVKPAYKSGYKTGIVNKSKIRCYNCNNLGHFKMNVRNQSKLIRIRIIWNWKLSIKLFLRNNKGRHTLHKENVGMILTMMKTVHNTQT